MKDERCNICGRIMKDCRILGYEWVCSYCSKLEIKESMILRSSTRLYEVANTQIKVLNRILYMLDEVMEKFKLPEVKQSPTREAIKKLKEEHFITDEEFMVMRNVAEEITKSRMCTRL